MSYICGRCKKACLGKPTRIVVSTRTKIYPKIVAKDGITVLDRGGKGTEIVKEMLVCNLCKAEN